MLGFGWTAAQAGVVVIALFAGNIGIKPVTTSLMRWLGIRRVVLGALAGSAAALLGIALLQPTTPMPLLLAVLLFSGVFRSIGFTAYNTTAYADVPATQMTHANTLQSTLQELGAGLGVAVGALLVRFGETVEGPARLAAGPDTPFRVAFVLLAVLLVVPAVQALRMSRTAGDVVTGRA